MDQFKHLKLPFIEMIQSHVIRHYKWSSFWITFPTFWMDLKLLNHKQHNLLLFTFQFLEMLHSSKFIFILGLPGPRIDTNRRKSYSFGILYIPKSFIEKHTTTGKIKRAFRKTASRLGKFVRSLPNVAVREVYPGFATKYFLPI